MNKMSYVAPAEGGPCSLYCAACNCWVPNRSSAEMVKEGFYAYSHFCIDGICDMQNGEIRTSNSLLPAPVGKPDFEENEYEQALFILYNGILAAKMAYGTGKILWVNEDAFEPKALHRALNAIIMDEAAAICKRYPAVVPASLNQKLRRIVQLNAEVKQLANEVAGELQARFDINVEEFDDSDVLENLTADNFVKGEVHEAEPGYKAYLKPVNHQVATENGTPGLYCRQTAGYCEDDYSGDLYVAMGDGTFLQIPYSM